MSVRVLATPAAAPRLSAAAARSLVAQALPFQRSGWGVSRKQPSTIELAQGEQQIQLGFRTHRFLLARIHQLQVTTTVPSMTGPSASCTLALRPGGRHARWACSGPGAATAHEFASRLAGNAITALARTLDLTALTATWCPTAGHWRLCVEPYAGSHLRVFFPPITYTTTLHNSEAQVITSALREMNDALCGTPLNPSGDIDERA